MEKLGLDIDSDVNPASKKVTPSTQESRRLSIERCIESLDHATYCDDKQCALPTCIKMTKVIQHGRICKRRQHQDCHICKQLIALCCYHAKSCNKQQCAIPYCTHIKQKLQQQQQQLE